MRDAGGKHHWPLPDDVKGSAVFSEDGDYRYVLRRTWKPQGRQIAFVGLNPSTADPSFDDPTVRKCWTWARSWRFGQMVMLNLLAYRATNPADLREPSDPYGDNRAYIEAIASESDMVVACWGESRWATTFEHPYSMGGPELIASDAMAKLLYSHCPTGIVYSLGNTKLNRPRHPLYLPNATKARPWRERHLQRETA